MTITLYGIPNCNQVKLARTWLTEQQLAFDFHDYKKAGITAAVINDWLQQVEWQSLLNRRGTTWRNLSAAEQAAVQDQQSAVQCMLLSPSLIKRPVLVLKTATGSEIVLGYSEPHYQQHFSITD